MKKDEGLAHKRRRISELNSSSFFKKMQSYFTRINTYFTNTWNTNDCLTLKYSQKSTRTPTDPKKSQAFGLKICQMLKFLPFITTLSSQWVNTYHLISKLEVAYLTHWRKRVLTNCWEMLHVYILLSRVVDITSFFVFYSLFWIFIWNVLSLQIEKMRTKQVINPIAKEEKNRQ